MLIFMHTHGSRGCAFLLGVQKFETEMNTIFLILN